MRLAPGLGSAIPLAQVPMSESKPASRTVTRLVSAEEREKAVKLLTAAFTVDAMPVAEFERRVAEVYSAESAQALREITRDLPEAAPEGEVLPAPTDHPTGLARRSTKQIGSLLSSVERRVQGPMPERLELRSVLGTMELDLRRAEFSPGVTEIRVRAILGTIEVELPESVRLEDEGRAFLGHFSVSGRSRARKGEAVPVVRITGRSILGSVEVELDD